MRKSRGEGARIRRNARLSRERNDMTGLKLADPIKSVVMTNIPGLTREHPTREDVEEFGACRICGCTDDNCVGCIEITGAPCSWANEKQDVCTACEMG